MIGVEGGAPVTLSVRATRHGPVLSDLLPDAARLFGADQRRGARLERARRGRPGRCRRCSASTGRATGRASSRRCATSARRCRTSSTPMRRATSASSRRAACRSAAQGDGRWPVPGWSGDYDWQGWIPFEALPRALDPPDGVLFNANNRDRAAGLPLSADRRLGGAAIGRAGSPSCSSAAPSDLADFAAMQADHAVAARAGPAADHARGRRRPSPAAAAAMAEARALGPGDARGRRRAAALRGVVSRAVAADLRRRAGRRCSTASGTCGRSSWSGS